MTSVAIAAPNVAAADAAEAIVRAGGNAIDAAITAAFVAMVNEVGLVSPSAGGFLTIQPPDGSAPVTIDGWMDMPGRTAAGHLGQGTWDVESVYGGGVVLTIGAGSVATHGAIAAFGEAHRRWGRLPWAELLAPAIDIARSGFRLSAASRYYLEYVHESIFGWDAASRAALHDEHGALIDTDLVVPDLADSLSMIARLGAGELYTGDLGRAIAQDVLDRGGILGPEDLAEYTPVVRPSLTARMEGWTLATNPPPAVGGVCVAAMLRLMAGHGLQDRDHLLRVQRRVLGERLRVFDHTEDLERDAAAFLDLVDRDGLGALESGSTAHVSTTDDSGTACAVTISSGYGSGMIARGTGIWLNNCLGEQELNPRGLHGLPPGSRLLSNMAPTVGRHVDGGVLAIGSPGADRITTAIVQALTGLVEDGLTLQEAIDHPRVHLHRPGTAQEEIKVEDPDDLTMYFGGVSGTMLTAEGTLVAAADPRRSGAVRIVS
ncbi:gamma-glutamyltransferase [Aeromicrobium sp. 636]|uniref:Gamma-glutamyltransferase n=1 Tax=Aeromicrobium senzhongii TaxID=2663859 RepID=A0A8I0EVM7_9ACTN|nr:gamma-glutamyltransferase [Aeromicrobium sp. 636]MBC9226198.1 gamma-glutamyltransferase [Aeromicrobium senzhongii]MCQ3998304.1 gamma-glutamyltransferase [Aeromicrobium sp. 636]